MTPEDRKNIEFVKIIEKYPCLYDQSTDHTVRDLSEGAWNVVAHEAKLTVPTAKEKWKKLRTEFARTSNNSGMSTRRPRYAVRDAMQFLVPILKRRKSIASESRNPSEFREKRAENSDMDEDRNRFSDPVSSGYPEFRVSSYDRDFSTNGIVPFKNSYPSEEETINPQMELLMTPRMKRPRILEVESMAPEIERPVTPQMDRQMTSQIKRQMISPMERKITSQVEREMISNEERQTSHMDRQMAIGHVERQMMSQIELQMSPQMFSHTEHHMSPQMEHPKSPEIQIQMCQQVDEHATEQMEQQLTPRVERVECLAPGDCVIEFDAKSSAVEFTRPRESQVEFTRPRESQAATVHLSGVPYDADQAFFTSLFPDLQKLTERRKRKFKRNAMELLDNLLSEQEDEESLKINYVCSSSQPVE